MRRFAQRCTKNFTGRRGGLRGRSEAICEGSKKQTKRKEMTDVKIKLRPASHPVLSSASPARCSLSSFAVSAIFPVLVVVCLCGARKAFSLFCYRKIEAGIWEYCGADVGSPGLMERVCWLAGRVVNCWNTPFSPVLVSLVLIPSPWAAVWDDSAQIVQRIWVAFGDLIYLFVCLFLY